MLSLRPRLLFSSQFSLTFSPPKRPLLHRSSSLSLRSSRCKTSVAMAATQTVEHVVLFKVKPETDPSKVESMLGGLNGLVSLDNVLHLTAGPVHRTESPDLAFTHMLHSRYPSQDDLAAYSAHPRHLGVVRESVLPICEDIMAVDWVADGFNGAAALAPGSAIRLTFLKPKEGLSPEQMEEEVSSLIEEIKAGSGDPDGVTAGVNFSPARAKGFSIATLVGFPGVEEMDSSKSLVQSEGRFEGVLVVDYVVPSPSL